jgi:ATP-binding cassette subfamily B protein
MMGQIAPVVGMAISSGQRIFEIVDAESEVEEAPDAVVLPRAAGEVRFEHVDFAYSGRGTVLDNVSFTARPGQVIALLGATGSGKSTIMNLIPRFYDVTAGRILIDGRDIRGVTLSSLRDQIGIVMQESVLFGTTIRENIRLGRPDAGDDEIIAAARAAQAHEFIAAATQGYDTLVGEMGVTLSGGQKQRISIARALLKDPRILLLDDATSSVDAVTEHLIQEALAVLMNGRTSFVIAQRLSTVRMADIILVMEDGRIGATGTHQELVESSPLYAQICREQLVAAPGEES